VTKKIYIRILSAAIVAAVLISLSIGSSIPVAEQVKVADILRQCVIAIIAVNGAWCVVLVPLMLGGSFSLDMSDKAHKVLSILASSLFGLFCFLFFIISFQIAALILRIFPIFVSISLQLRQIGCGVLSFAGIMSTVHIFITLFAPMDFGLKLSFFMCSRIKRASNGR